MQINISGKHVDLGQAFQEHVELRLGDGITKYFERVPAVDVVVSREKQNYFRVDIHGNPGTHSHQVLKSHAESGDIYEAFNMAADKIEKQFRRFKRKLTNHHAQSGDEVEEGAA